jgi:hypothetical protein
MKVLLLGEYSGLYKNLSEGLRVLGHNVKIVSDGDSWKHIDSDIVLSKLNQTIIGKIKYRINMYQILSKITGYDIIQLINPFFIPVHYFPRYKIIKKLLNNNTRLFLSAAGDDAYYWKYGRKILYAGYFEDNLKYDLKRDSCSLEANSEFNFNKYVADNCSGIIPIMYEYETVYRSHNNCCKTIPIPMNVEKINYSPNRIKDKIVIFHGLNRYGCKGTRFVEEAFEILKKKYPNDLELIINNRMPLNDYLQMMDRVNVVVDQTYSYSCGMNAIYALAMGKVVMGGGDPVSFSSLGIKETPVVNILPNVKDIVDKVEWLLENRYHIEEIGYQGRILVENIHHYVKVAQQYVSVWNDNESIK